MFAAFDRAYLDIPSPDTALNEYTSLLGIAPQGNCLSLANLDICLRETAGEPGIAGLNLLDDDLAVGTEQALDTAALSIAMAASHHRDPEYRQINSATGIYAVDHLVLQTRDADACIALFGEQLGLRLALDQEVPEWGGRMLFFRHGKMTLEVIQNLKEPPVHDFFWGITYLCHDIDQTIAALDERTVAHSPIRSGRKPGTRVATIKSHTLGIPTLIIGPA
ncbi:hypothetical protein BST95_06800 [Halioglobus japonicus]|uniref:VOC domain-containing protein n=1 Tax=Halioglobus japonicus TaxID=930805 RepID=A0AAP8MB60_9GAMM|nr:VOC family protein [Halioglobus japonicus]AQA17989.1 hypothetical protein BST95_06800 [Halioglobus japonicus]PLW84545.1 hypothetical protein C0029_18690 [Halioglobus japonicus]GHD24302.1 hypothetical protein GCM10007052_37790 [Halioglobus japonicus]